MPHYSFIEIGTSDFETICQTCRDDEVGISVEPIKEYLDALPSKKNVTKLNVAISDTDGFISIFHVSPNILKKYNLPSWLRGCNSISKPHPTTVREILSKGLNPADLIIEDRVELMSIQTLFEKYSVTSIDNLKIDTEGHDCVILDAYIRICQTNPSLYAKHIEFETNILSSKSDQIRVIDYFKSVGYRVLKNTNNTVMVR